MCLFATPQILSRKEFIGNAALPGIGAIERSAGAGCRATLVPFVLFCTFWAPTCRDVWRRGLNSRIMADGFMRKFTAARKGDFFELFVEYSSPFQQSKFFEIFHLAVEKRFVPVGGAQLKLESFGLFICLSCWSGRASVSDKFWKKKLNNSSHLWLEAWNGGGRESQHLSKKNTKLLRSTTFWKVKPRFLSERQSNWIISRVENDLSSRSGLDFNVYFKTLQLCSGKTNLERCADIEARKWNENKNLFASTCQRHSGGNFSESWKKLLCR